MTIPELNQLDSNKRAEVLATCCGAVAWVEQMNAIFPVVDEAALLREAERIWFQCRQVDWLEGFRHHPEIGNMDALKQKYSSADEWAAGEQSLVKQSPAAVLQALAASNAAYKEKFGYIFIVCASGKTADEMLGLLVERLKNPPEQEIHFAMQEQGKITALRLKKLLAS